MQKDYDAMLIIDKAQGTKYAQGILSEINQLKLTATQRELLSGFYQGRREATDDNRIPYATLERIAAIIGYESDLAVSIMQSLDDCRIELLNEKRQRDLEKMKAKGR